MEKDLYILVVYLFYGGAFFALGVSITSRDTSMSKLGIARYLWIFALFAYIHGSHEWYEMFLKINNLYVVSDPSVTTSIIKLGLVLISFLLFLLFGVCVFGIARPGQGMWLGILFAVLVGTALISILFPWKGSAADYFTWAEFRIRNLIALPAALLSGTGFILYSRTVLGVSRKGALNFTGAGLSVIVYGVFTGLIPSGTYISSAHLPVELFRGISALFILHFMMRALHTFDEERKAVIEDRLDRFVRSEKLSALGRLAAGVAHEINNPLANMSLNLEILKKDLQINPVGSQLNRIDTMERNLERASRTARELLHVSSERDSDLVETKLESVVEGVLNLLGPRKREFDIAVNLDGAGTIWAIPWKIEEALLNILINAMDATPPGGKILVTGKREKNRIFLEIADTGIGIDSENLPRVMEPFFTTKEVGQGTGLGLSICYGIMELHNGQIGITSNPDEGTVVTLSFPEGKETDDKYPGS
jgi:two-component system NtrC family sensor kinase